MRDLRIGQWGASEPVLQGSLANIKQLIEMDLEAADVGWGPEPARLFSIDAAMLLFRGHADLLSDRERKAISRTLGEARRLAVDRVDSELGWLRNELASHLDRSSARGVWITALNALLPSPYRAAEAVVKTHHRSRPIRSDGGHARAASSATSGKAEWGAPHDRGGRRGRRRGLTQR